MKKKPTKVTLTGENLIQAIANQICSIALDWDSLQALAEHVFGLETSEINLDTDEITFLTYEPEDFEQYE